jgi:hypothetical protein
MTRTITADVPNFGLSSALAGLKLTRGVDLPVNISKSGIVRAALAVVAGKSADEIMRCATGNSSPNLESGGKSAIGAQVPEDLLREAQARLGEDAEIAFTVRVGLAMAAGFTQEQAESWAHMTRGRPRKQATSAA